MKVVEEVKKWLDPYYREKSVTKDEYKQIVRKCVNKVGTPFILVILRKF